MVLCERVFFECGRISLRFVMMMCVCPCVCVWGCINGWVCVLHFVSYYQLSGSNRVLPTPPSIVALPQVLLPTWARSGPTARPAWAAEVAVHQLLGGAKACWPDQSDTHVGRPSWTPTRRAWRWQTPWFLCAARPVVPVRGLTYREKISSTGSCLFR